MTNPPASTIRCRRKMSSVATMMVDEFVFAVVVAAAAGVVNDDRWVEY